MKIVLRFTSIWREGLGLGVSVIFPCRCADVRDGHIGTVRSAGLGFGLLTHRLYIDLTWDFVSFGSHPKGLI